MDNDRPQLETYDSLAQLIDHSLLAPDLTEDTVRDGCLLAVQYGVATVVVRPSDIDIAVRAVRGSNVRPASVVGFPHGSSQTAVKVYECRDLIRRGAREIDAVLNIGKLVSRQWLYLETELVQLAKACHEEGVTFKAVFENAYLDYEQKLVASKIAKRAEADFVSTSTGFASSGWTKDDLALMISKSGWRYKVKAEGNVDTLDRALEVYQYGADRIGTAHTAEILDAWRKQVEAKQPAASVIS